MVWVERVVTVATRLVIVCSSEPLSERSGHPWTVMVVVGITGGGVSGDGREPRDNEGDEGGPPWAATGATDDQANAQASPGTQRCRRPIMLADTKRGDAEDDESTLASVQCLGYCVEFLPQTNLCQTSSGRDGCGRRKGKGSLSRSGLLLLYLGCVAEERVSRTLTAVGFGLFPDSTDCWEPG